MSNTKLREIFPEIEYRFKQVILNSPVLSKKYYNSIYNYHSEKRGLSIEKILLILKNEGHGIYIKSEFPSPFL
jgi:hypothetical protein